jgi:hypothetical protein
MLRSIIAGIFCSSVASAETTEVPRLSNGAVDVDAVFSSFKVASPFVNDAEVSQFDGELLGQSFEASLAGNVSAAPFDLTIRAATLSDEATFMVAVLLTDIICMKQNRGSAGVKWKESATRQGDLWRVTSSCSTEPREPGLGGG